MKIINYFRRSWFCPAAAMAVLLLAAGSTSAAIQDLAVGQVGTSTATATWVASEVDALPGAVVYSDADLTVPIQGLEWEWQPLPELGTPRRPGNEEQREENRRTRERRYGRGRMLHKIGGLKPGHTYYLVAEERNATTGIVLAESDPVSFTTAHRTGFISESRQLVVSFNALAPDAREGALVRLDVATSPYPLFATLRNVGSEARAILDLSALLDSSGETQMQPAGELNLLITLPDLPFAPLQATVSYEGSFMVAAHTTAVFSAAEPEVAGYQFDNIENQYHGVPFTITIRAVDSQGHTVTHFDGNVALSANIPLATGGGPTPAFSAGILHGHEIRLDAGGLVQLQAVDSEGNIGESNEFELSDLFYTLFLNADPPLAGSVLGAGSQPGNAFAPIEAVPAEGYKFVRWVGETVLDQNSASTHVLMDGSKSLTAVFGSISAAGYDDWALRYFLRNAGNEAIVGLDRDPNNNGIVNLLEFAFGRNPNQTDRDYRMPKLIRDESGGLVFSYHRRHGHPQLEYVIEVSDQMTSDSWTPHTPDLADISIHPGEEDVEQVNVRISLPEPVFVRMQVRFVTPEP